jgi:hypothetical protein
MEKLYFFVPTYSDSLEFENAARLFPQYERR